MKNLELILKTNNTLNIIKQTKNKEFRILLPNILPGISITFLKNVFRNYI